MFPFINVSYILKLKLINYIYKIIVILNKYPSIFGFNLNLRDRLTRRQTLLQRNP